MAPPTDRRPPPRLASQTPKPAEPAVQQRAWAALTLGLLSLLGLSLAGGLRRAIYVIAVTLLIGALAAWLGGSSIARARQGGTARPRGAVGGTVLGALGLTFSALMLLAFALFWTELSAYQNCLAGANTLSAQHACSRQFRQSVTSQLRVVQGG